MKDLNLQIKKGDCIGIIGDSGSGKSTFIDILSGLIEPEENSILIDKTDLKLFIDDWKKNIGYVSQHLFLIDDTIKNNIAFGKKEIDLSLLNKAVKSSMLEDFVSNLPNNLNTSVGELGKKISGGQRQRIGIARALYKDPEILVFDEATNALDPNTEKNIMSTIYNLKNKKTIIIISHKFNILNKCDKIFQIIEGRMNLLND